MDTTVFPGIEPIQIIKFASGACGGLVRTIEWFVDNPGQKLDLILVGRNIFYGGVGGIILGADVISAFTSGLAGEYLLQTIGKRTTTATTTITATEVEKSKVA